MATILNYPSWKEQNLTEVEMSDPHVVIERFFDFARLPEIKQMLREIFEIMVRKNYPHSPDSIQHDNIIYFFEKLEQLAEAAHRLYLREDAGQSSAG